MRLIFPKRKLKLFLKKHSFSFKITLKKKFIALIELEFWIFENESQSQKSQNSQNFDRLYFPKYKKILEQVVFFIKRTSKTNSVKWKMCRLIYVQICPVRKRIISTQNVGIDITKNRWILGPSHNPTKHLLFYQGITSFFPAADINC